MHADVNIVLLKILTQNCYFLFLFTNDISF